MRLQQDWMKELLTQRKGFNIHSNLIRIKKCICDFALAFRYEFFLWSKFKGKLIWWLLIFEWPKTIFFKCPCNVPFPSSRKQRGFACCAPWCEGGWYAPPLPMSSSILDTQFPVTRPPPSPSVVTARPAAKAEEHFYNVRKLAFAN